MKHLMIDLEAMGKTKNAAIMAIGACYFEPSTGEIGATFHQQIDISTNGVIDASTVIWWLKQDHDARSKFFNNDSQTPAPVVLQEFRDFVHPRAQVWGNGIAFDLVILESAFAEAGIKTPWEFWNHRDVRTVVELGRAVGIDPKKDLPFEGVKHDALADAIHQARYVSMIWQKLTQKDNLK